MAASKTPSLLPELRAFAANIGELPYEKLLPTAAEAGWEYRLVQRDVVFTPLNEYMVTFDVLVGKASALEPLDTVSVTIPGSSGRPVYPVSLVARVQALQTLIYLFFGRFPPPPVPAEQINVQAPAGTADIVLPDEDDGGEYIPGEEVSAPIEVVDHLEPDGVPIFVDLYSLGDPSAEVVTAVLDAVDDFLERAASVETINAMGAKNPMMLKFVKDLGTTEDTAALLDMITRRRNLVAPPVLSNARRRVSAERAN